MLLINRSAVNFDDMAAGINRRRLIQSTVFNELCRLVDPGEITTTVHIYIYIHTTQCM